jgi:16S rRNA (guanine527-N7)-methyltransferase
VKLAAVAPPHAVDALSTILQLQAHDATASTTIRDPGEAVQRHVADSLSALELPFVREAKRIADLGSGAGWPGLALAAALPGARVSLVESAIRHCRYLERAVEVSGLENVTVVNARAETWPEGIGAHDLVVVRALAPLPVLVEYAAPLLELGGALVAWKGRVEPVEEADGLAAASEVGMSAPQAVPVQPFEQARERYLYLISKVRPTPARYPRRPGMARKRPIQASSRR